MTSVLGHLNFLEFPTNYRKWHGCQPISLFEAPVVDSVAVDKRPIADNIKQQAQYSRALFIWTDCDREGENIGGEVRRAAQEGNHNIEIKRAKFSNTERALVVWGDRAGGSTLADGEKPCDSRCSTRHQPRRSSSERCCRKDRTRSTSWRRLHQVYHLDSADTGGTIFREKWPRR